MADWKKQIIEESLQKAVIKAVKVYGIEGTEKKIKELYCLPSTRILRDKLLNTLYNIYKFGKGFTNENRD